MNHLNDPIRLTLRDVENDTNVKIYCGPTAIAAVTGLPPSVVLDACRTARDGEDWPEKHLHPPRIKGINISVLGRALRILGYAGRWVEVCDRPTLAAWLETRSPYERRLPCIVNVTRHYVAVAGYMFADTFTKGQVVEVDEAPHRRKRVERVFFITGRVAPGTVVSKHPAQIAEEKRAQRRESSRGYREFAKFARSLGATWEKERGDDSLTIHFSDGRCLTVTHWLLPDDWFGATHQVEAFLSSPTPDPLLFWEDGDRSWRAMTV